MVHVSVERMYVGGEWAGVTSAMHEIIRVSSCDGVRHALGLAREF